jgi:KaiC/GvpD/RAD55 family RecA-like ATPase
MVEIRKIFDGEEMSSNPDLCKLAKEFGEKVGEYPNSSTFITIEDASKSSSDISLIENENNSESEVQRDFIFI